MVDVCWMNAGCMLGVCWMYAGCMLDVRVDARVVTAFVTGTDIPRLLSAPLCTAHNDAAAGGGRNNTHHINTNHTMNTHHMMMDGVHSGGSAVMDETHLMPNFTPTSSLVLEEKREEGGEAGGGGKVDTFEQPRDTRPPLVFPPVTLHKVRRLGMGITNGRPDQRPSWREGRDLLLLQRCFAGAYTRWYCWSIPKIMLVHYSLATLVTLEVVYTSNLYCFRIFSFVFVHDQYEHY